MKKKGFTLIELIVVIAIIGVLAAILVPAMLGYVKKSKITTANTTAKSIYNAFNSSLTDMDSEDYKIKLLSAKTNDYTSENGNDYSSKAVADFKKAKTDVTEMQTVLTNKVITYFSDITKVSEFGVIIEKTGACTAAAALNGSYPGGYPHAITVDEYNKAADASTDINLAWALSMATTK